MNVICKTVPVGLLLVIATQASFGQGKDGVLRRIKEEVQVINKDTAYKTMALTAEAFLEQSPDGGAQLTGYFKGGKIKKVHQWIGLSRGNEITEFYYSNGKLIFVYEQFDAFIYVDSLQAFDYTKTEHTFAGRYYFYNGTLFKHITTGHSRFEDASLDIEAVLQNQSDRNIKLLEVAGNDQ